MKKITKILKVSSLMFILVSIAACDKSNNDNNMDESMKFSSSMSKEEIAKVLSAKEEMKSTDLFVEDNKVNNKQRQRKNKIEITNDKYVMDEFPEISNSTMFVDNRVGGIRLDRNQSIDYIENYRKGPNKSDVWIDDSSDRNQLMTTNNSDVTLFDRDKTSIDDYSMYKVSNYEDGRKRIENYSYTADSNIHNFSSSIENEIYKSFELNDSYSNYISYDNSLGYWQFLSCSDFGDSIGFSSYAFCENLTYEVHFSKELGSDNMYLYSIEILSPDGKCDILKYTASGIEIYLSGFTGVDRIEKELVDGKIVENNVTLLTDLDIYLENGNVIRTNDTFANGKIRCAGSFGVDPAVQNHTTASIDLGFYDSTEDIRTKFNYFKEFLDETGMKSKVDIDLILEEIKKIEFKANHLSETYKWNGYGLGTQTSLKAAVNQEIKELEKITNEYEKVKNNPVAAYDEDDNNYVYASLANINSSLNNLEVIDNKIKIRDLNLKLNNTDLLDTNKEYKVSFALAKKESNIISYILETDNKIKFNNGFDITISSEFTLPDTLDSDEYKLIVYVSTLDDIRVTEKENIEFNIEKVIKTNKKIITLIQKDNDLIVRYNINEEQVINASKETYTYQELVEELALYALENNYEPSFVLEFLFNTNYEVVEENEVIIKGTYRMSFINYETKNGYIYITI